jgi:hypothetical protein
MKKTYKPFTLHWNDQVPVDISFVFEHEKPAGKHGFLKVQGDQLVFADGAPGRFWGTNFNSGANFPDHAYAEMVACRLAKFGVNIVRTHQMDAEWATPNIFQFNRARPKDHTRSLDPESMDRLDYLFYCLKQHGIYIYLDLLTYRQFRPGDGVDAVDSLPQAAKPYLYFDPRLIELQKEFNEALWKHHNPYTGLAYKDDPAIVLCELVNEADPFAQPVVLEPYRTRFEQMFLDWLASQDLPAPALPVDFNKPGPVMARFFVQVMQNYYREMIAHLQKIGVKIPINGTNWWITLGVSAAQSAVDFCDSHVYWNFPLWENIGTPGTANAPMVAAYDNAFAMLSMNRLAGKPFFVSEWDHAWPDEWRAESSLAYAAVAALQGWSGVTIHTYRYSTWDAEDRLGGGGETINGITYRNHFDSANDPAKFGLFYHAALLLRRGDVQPARKTVGVCFPADPQEWLLKRPGEVPAIKGLPEQHKTVLLLDGAYEPVLSVAKEPVDLLQPWDQPLVAEDQGSVMADNGQMGRNWQERWGWIDTPRTRAVYGFFDPAKPVRLHGLELDIQTDFAVIALSSLTDDPLERSASILLSAVGRCDNTAAAYNPEHTLLDPASPQPFGRPPVLIEPIQAKIRLATHRPNLKVLVISEHGELVTKLPVQYTDGTLSFEIGPQPAWNPSTMYYLIKV